MELDQYRYIVVKSEDIAYALNDCEYAILTELLTKINQYRITNNKSTDHRYIVIKNNMKIYPKVVNLLMEELNDK